MEVEYDFYYALFQCVPTTPPESSQQILKWFHLFNFSKAIQIQPIQQRTQFNKQAIAKIAISTVVLQFMGGKASMAQDAAPSYYLRMIMNINNSQALDMYDSGWTRSSGGGMRQQLVYRSQANILRNARQFGGKSRTPIFAQFSSKSMCWILHISSLVYYH